VVLHSSSSTTLDVALKQTKTVTYHLLPNPSLTYLITSAVSTASLNKRILQHRTVFICSFYKTRGSPGSEDVDPTRAVRSAVTNRFTGRYGLEDASSTCSRNVRATYTCRRSHKAEEGGLLSAAVYRNPRETQTSVRRQFAQLVPFPEH
jgi:hypothetical protein